MRESVEYAELVFLKKSGRDHWIFQVRPSPSFERVFDSLVKSRVFTAHKAHIGPVCHYEINDEGIWLLSHVFSNWDEMYKQATKKSPWEESWQKRAEQGEVCAHCKVREAYPLRCPACQKHVCTTCFYNTKEGCPEAQQGEPEQKKKACSVCGRHNTSIVHCSECQAELCHSCLYVHHRGHDAQKRAEQKGADFYYCSGCSTYFNNAFHPPAWKCSECQADLCSTCRLSHTHVRARSPRFEQQSYTTQQTSDHINLDDLRKIFEQWNWSNEPRYYYNYREDAARQAKAEEERMRKKAAEEEARKQREKKDQEFFENFMNSRHRFYYDFGSWQSDNDESHAGQQQRTSSNSQSSTSTPPKRPVLTSEIREAFKFIGLPPAATEQEIKRKFRVLAKQAHPDAGGSEEQFKKLNNACEKALAYAKDSKPKFV